MSSDDNSTPDQLLKRLIEMRTQLFRDRIDALAEVYGSRRAVARALNIDQAYLHRLARGEKQNPSRAVLRKLGLGG